MLQFDRVQLPSGIQGTVSSFFVGPDKTINVLVECDDLTRAMVSQDTLRALPTQLSHQNLVNTRAERHAHIGDKIISEGNILAAGTGRYLYLADNSNTPEWISEFYLNWI